MRVTLASWSRVLSPLLLALAGTLPAQTYTPYGAGCPGATGVAPSVASDSLPILGMRLRLRVDNVLAGTGLFHVLGFQQVAFPYFGCILLVQPATAAFTLADAAGQGRQFIDIPPNQALVGIAVYNQWAALDPGAPQGFAFSDAGCAVVGNPQLAFARVLPMGGGVGTVVVARMRNLGTNNPDDCCLRATDAFGNTTLIRPTSIVHDPSTGDDVVTGTVVTAGGQNPVGVLPSLGMMRGTGGTGFVPGAPKLSAPADSWGWQGAGLPQAGANAGPFQPVPTSGSTNYTFTTVGNTLTASIPTGSYATNTQVLVDAHWDVNCPGQPTVHYDHFLGTMTVLAPMTVTEMRDELAARVQAVFNQLYPGKVLVNNPTPSGPDIVIRMVDPTCTIVSGGGAIVFQ